MKRLFYKASIVISIITIAASCSSYLDDVAPKNQIPQESLTDDDMSKVLNGVYSDMESFVSAFIYDWDIKGENYQAGPGFSLVDPMVMNPGDNDILKKWQRCFSTLSQVNFLVESYENVSSASSTMNAAGGAGYFFRAYIYYTMVTRWGGVPLLSKRTFDLVPISDEAKVWDFIKADLVKAESLLPDFSDKFYVSKSAVYMLRARAHLALGEMSEAAAAADKVIANSSHTLTATSAEFAANFVSTSSSRELVLALSNKRTSSQITLYQKVNDIDATWEYSPATEAYSSLFADDASRTGDIRAAATFGSESSRLIKYPNGLTGQFIGNDVPNQSPIVVFRLSEAYLTKAEALGNSADGRAALQTLLDKRYSTATVSSTISDDEFENLILDERHREFYGEGYRWYDLKRTGRTDLFESLADRNYLMYYPIPQNEIDLAGSEAYPQNAGY